MVGVVGAGTGVWFWERAQVARILPGVKIMGVPVGELDRAQALIHVNAKLATIRATALTLAANDRSWTVTLGDLGLSGAVDAAIDEALARSGAVDPVRRAWRRVHGVPTAIDIPLLLGIEPSVIDEVANKIAAEVRRDPSNARAEIVDGRFVVHPGHSGVAVDRGAIAALLRDTVDKALAGSTPPSPAPLVPLRDVQPAITAAAYNLALVVRIDEQVVNLYRDGAIAETYPIASGRFGYDTPLGDFYVTEKLYDPEWINPAPKGWGKDLPLSIPPGPGNPLGERALGISAEAIYLHETQASVGTRASHGCMRMRPEDLRQFFEATPLGTPVIIIDGPITYTPAIDLALSAGPATPGTAGTTAPAAV